MGQTRFSVRTTPFVQTVITDILSPTSFIINQNTTATTGTSANIGLVSGATTSLSVTANTANLLTVANTANLVPGQMISGTGLSGSAGWYISAINSATTFTVSNTTGAAALANSAAIGSQTPIASPNFAGSLTVAGGTVRVVAPTASADVVNNGFEA